MDCRKCGAQMHEGKATQQTFVAGIKDFPSDDYASTYSAGGAGVIIECMKCPSCGYSVTK